MENENNLIGTAVLKIFEFVVSLRWLCAIRSHVLIEQHRDSAGVEIAAARDIRCFEMIMTQRTISDFFQLVAF